MSLNSRRIQRWLACALCIGVITPGILSGCSVSFQEDLSTQIYVFGPLRGYVEVDGEQYGYALDRPEHVPSENADRSGRPENLYVVTQAGGGVPGYRIGVPRGERYETVFVVATSGPTFIQVNTLRPSTGMWDTDAGVIAHALFFIDAPVGAMVMLKSHAGQDPEEVRVKVDRDADGEADDELKPVGTADEEEISPFGPASGSTIRELPDGRVEVTLTGRPADDIQLYYALFPQAPDGQLYDGPFIVDGPSYLVFGAFDTFGRVGRLNEEHLLGGLAQDLEIEIPIDGTPVEVNLSQPGQQALLTYPVQEGDKFELVIEPSTIGIFPDAGLSSREIIGRDGRIFDYMQRHQYRPPTSDQIRLNPDWGYTGTVVVRLTNLYEHAPELIVDGPAIEVEVVEVLRAGHHDYARFTAKRGDNLWLHIVDTDIDDDSGTGILRILVRGQEGSVILPGQSNERPISGPGGTFRFIVPRSGSYLVELTSDQGTTGSVTLELRKPGQ